MERSRQPSRLRPSCPTNRTMRIKLEERWVEQLLAWPESGMGYQRVDVRLADGREAKDVPAFNAAEIEMPDEFAGGQIAAIKLHTAPKAV
jgi:hypothetical protein